MKAAILAVGTELTSGQVLNRNASWISQQLKSLGLPATLHLTVADDRKSILGALDYCAQNANLIFVTGGLGPTSDDFTRELICEFCKKPTFFHEASWQKIQTRLNSRGLRIHEMQKQQCYFPKGAEVLENANGTANGFYLRVRKKHFFVLPGPPGEIEVIWRDHLQTRVAELLNDIDPEVTLSWDCLGQPEAEIASLVEPLLKSVDLTPAYRVHLPYVEFKVSFAKSQSQKIKARVKKIDEALHSFAVLRNGEDAATLLMEKLAEVKSVQIVDEISGGFLWQRILPHAHSLLRENRLQMDTQVTPGSVSHPPDAHLRLHMGEPGVCEMVLVKNHQRHGESIRSPYQGEHWREREKQYFAEMALLYWLRNW